MHHHQSFNFLGVKLFLSLFILTATLSLSNKAHAEFHQIDIFTGLATQSRTTSGSNQTALALGARYEYRLPSSDSLIGIGATADMAFFRLTEMLFSLLLMVHPIDGEGLMIAGGPGFGVNTPDTRALIRFATGWSFQTGEYFLTPRVDLNLISRNRAGFEFDNLTTSFLVGVNFGMRF